MEALTSLYPPGFNLRDVFENCVCILHIFVFPLLILASFFRFKVILIRSFCNEMN